MVKKWNTPPAMEIDPKKVYRARMETDKGEMVIELFAAKAPKTVNNFVFLARQGFYENVIFHRVIANFMVQGGDPTGTGTGGPGYNSRTSSTQPETRQPGMLSMANAGPNTNGSQFFITHVPTPGWMANTVYLARSVKAWTCLCLSRHATRCNRNIPVSKS